MKDMKKMHNFGLLVLRLAIGGLFIKYGWAKLGDMPGTVEGFTAMGFFAPAFFAYLAALVELVCGAALVLGVWTKFAAMLLAATMLVALLFVHAGNPDGFGIMAQFSLALFGASVGLMSAGGGDWELLKHKCTWCPVCRKK